MDIIELVNKARVGDKKAFMKLITTKRDSLYRTAFSYVHNQDDCLDILQETFIKAYSSLYTLKNPEHFFSWLTRILINLCCSHLRKKQKTVSLSDNLPVNGYIDKSFSEVEAETDLDIMLDGLDEKYRQVLILKYLGDYTLVEIGKILNCPLGTVKSRLNYGLRELRKRAGGMSGAKRRGG